MTNILLVGVIVCQLLPLLIGLVLLAKLKSSLSRSVHSFVDPPSPERQSPAADILDLVSTRFASAFSASIKGWLMAENSAAVRQDKRDARQQVLGSSPMLAGLAAFAPGLMRKFGKDPAMLQMIGGLIQNATGGGSQREAVSSNNGGSENPFKV